MMFATRFCDVVHMATQGRTRKLILESLQRFEEVVSHSNAKVLARKACVLTAIALPFILTNVAEAGTPPPSSLDSDTVIVEASGRVPGLTQAQLTAYLALKMREEITAPWQFSAGQAGTLPPPNRVVWSFKTLRVEWKGGSHRGFPSPTHSVSHVSAEVKLYLNNTYQMTMLVQPSLSGGSNDRVLSEMVHNVAHTLFVENKPDTQAR
jgi:hypothetical protein